MNPRLIELCHRMKETKVDAALLLHHRDILYYAGTVRPAALLVTPDETILFVRRGIDPARAEATVTRVEPMQGFSSVTAAVSTLGLTGGVLGTEFDMVSAHLYKRLGQAFPNWTLADISPLILDQRTVKDASELAATRQAAHIADVGQEATRQAAVPGMSELTLAAHVEAAIRRAGHEGFQPLRNPAARGAGVLLMSGEHLTVRGGHGLVITGAGLSPGMPYGPSQRELRPGDLVVVDIGSTYAGYTGDESRTFVIGPATAAQRALFEVALEAEQAVLDLLEPGACVADLYPAAEIVVARGAPPYFAPNSLVLPGFVGHGIGLELDEPPVLWPREEMELQAGMVLAIEIEVSAPSEGTMVKVEDTVIVDAQGYEMLTDTPRELIECGSA